MTHMTLEEMCRPAKYVRGDGLAFWQPRIRATFTSADIISEQNEIRLYTLTPNRRWFQKNIWAEPIVAPRLGEPKVYRFRDDAFAIACEEYNRQEAEWLMILREVEE